ncbi:RNA polymerase sigma factor SigJ [Kitasatospora sp. NPDC048296]|uniref:RNA polymerase sigma factor SigJ n=1 Tax=Kitasatospora sp. NPDC048296 TaxID=3364048 RepID=UPI003714CBEE
MTPSPADAATQVFLEHRELLFSMVYSMLGGVADTEDVLQETWLAWAHRGGDAIESPRAYLVRIAVNKALARRSAIARRRESYIGPWLPEPLVDAPEPSDDSVSVALLVVLETLTPLERAVFLLHEVFGYAHTEIAAMLDRTPAAVRQVAHRAREHVHARRPRYPADRRLQQEATERFTAAVTGGDLNGLLELLAPDVTLWADGGGKAPAAGPRPVHGRDAVAALLVGGINRAPRQLDVRYRPVNGGPSALLFAGDSPYAVLTLDLDPDNGRVSGIYFVTNPDKLSHIS